LGIEPRNDSWLVRMLEIYYWPVMTLSPRIAPLFGYADWAIWYAPLLALLVGAVLCSVVWWMWLNHTRGLRVSASGHKIVVMRRSRGAVRPAKRARAMRSGRSIAAAAFKARCLELMDHVRETGVEYVVTKHGEPVAKLVSYAAPGRTPLFGSMKGTVLKYERPFDPIDAVWDINRD
jgi:prevent-host-death family protein